jgi:hypothetical protein
LNQRKNIEVHQKVLKSETTLAKSGKEIFQEGF